MTGCCLADDGMLFEFVNETLRANGGVRQEDDARWAHRGSARCFTHACIDCVVKA
jgi:hypothetical protein